MSSPEQGVTERTVGSIAEAWWKRLSSQPGARARLKRSGSILEIILETETHALRRQFLSLPATRASIEVVALVAGVLAWVDERSDLSPGAQLGRAAEKQSAIEPRLRRLLREERGAGDELLAQWRRMLTLLKGTSNPSATAEVLFYWGDSVKKRLATEFYENCSGLTTSNKN
jgi:CRISPR type I-E-associated protein CasB/Cse2